MSPDDEKAYNYITRRLNRLVAYQKYQSEKMVGLDFQDQPIDEEIKSLEGKLKELRNEGVVEVQDDFELICWDFVSNPSTHGAFMGMMKESVEKNKTNKYGKVNDLITSILCEDGKCRI